MSKLLVVRLTTVLAFLALGPLINVVAAEPAGPESKRLARAKDYIDDERWSQAIDELRTAVADKKETRKDEVLYWLAHSLNQVGDRAASVETISRLEREHPSSKWVKPARALRIEIAVRLNRSDVLWYAAMPPPPPPAPAPVPNEPAKPRPTKTPTKESSAPPLAKGPVKLPPPPMPAQLWYVDGYTVDPDLQIQALRGLMKTDADQAIQILADIVFDNPNPGRASRAVLVLAQSELPKAVDVVIRVAKMGPEPVQIAAVKALGQMGGPKISSDLLQVYPEAGDLVKLQIVRSFGERANKNALQQIVQLEKNPKLRYVAIEGLGQAGAVAQLSAMYKTAASLERRAIITGLFNARADAELIRICEVERKGGNPKLASEVEERLRLLSTPKAKEYLLKVSEKR